MIDTITSYVSCMKRVVPTNKEHIALRAALSRERHAIETAGDALDVGSSENCSWHRMIARRGFMAAAAAAAVVLVGVLGSGVIHEQRGATSAEYDGPVLAVYADGFELENGMVSLPSNFGSSIDWSQDDQGDYYANVKIDLSLAGTGYRDITYTIEEGDATFRFLQSRDTVPWFGEQAEFQDVKSFTVSSDSVKGTYSLDVTIPQEVVDEATGGSDVLDNPFTVFALAAEQLDGVSIRIEATDESGETRTHTYVLHPVDDFAKRYEALKMSEDEDSNEGASSSLFIMEAVE